MIDIIELQKRFYANFKIDCPQKPTLLDKDHLKMRLNFLLEELIELSRSCGFDLDIEQSDQGQCTLSIRESLHKVEPEQILDALVDLQVVLLGTIQLLGFFSTTPSIIIPGMVGDEYKDNAGQVKHSVFEEAYLRVWIANMKKVRCESAEDSKRGFAIDLKKPEGWTPPVLVDLVQEFISYKESVQTNMLDKLFS
jgi:hypothetical protein